MTGEQILRSVRAACEVAGVPVETDDVIARRRLEDALERQFRSDDLCCEDCGFFDREDD